MTREERMRQAETVRIHEHSFKLAPVDGKVWFDVIGKGFERTRSEFDFQKLLMLHTIVEWDVCDEAGTPVPVTMENLLSRLDARYYFLLGAACSRVNNLPLSEKNALSVLSSPPLAGQNGNISES